MDKILSLTNEIFNVHQHESKSKGAVSDLFGVGCYLCSQGKINIGMKAIKTAFQGVPGNITESKQDRIKKYIRTNCKDKEKMIRLLEMAFAHSEIINLFE